MKFSWKRLVALDQAAARYLTANPKESKVKYALERVLKQVGAVQEQVQARLTDIEIDCCEVSGEPKVPTDPPPGIILRDAQGNLVFTRDGLKLRNDRQHEFLNEPKFEIEPHFVDAIPADMGPLEIMFFTDFIFSPETVAQAAQPPPEVQGNARVRAH